jgi:hypothetical protein
MLSSRHANLAHIPKGERGKGGKGERGKGERGEGGKGERGEGERGKEGEGRERERGGGGGVWCCWWLLCWWQLPPQLLPRCRTYSRRCDCGWRWRGLDKETCRGGFGFVGWRGGGEWRERGWRWWGATSTSTAIMFGVAALGVVEKGLKGDTTCGCPAGLPKVRERHFPGGGGRFACVQGPCSLFAASPLNKQTKRATCRGSRRPAIDGLGEKREARTLWLVEAREWHPCILVGASCSSPSELSLRLP